MSILPSADTLQIVALMPQWDFLNFLAEHGKRYKTFDLHMSAEATELIEEDGRVVGCAPKTPDGTLTIRADLVVGCDGRHSTVREKAGFKSDDYGAPMDVLWFRVTHKADDEHRHLRPRRGRQDADHARSRRLLAVRLRHPEGRHREGQGGRASMHSGRRVVDMSPFLADRVGELKSWDDVKLLSVTVDRLEKWWRPGLLCIGDAAHAMSPIGGVGINMAVQDAVAAANRLGGPLCAGTVTDDDLHAIQDRRTLPVRFTQWLQLNIQKRVISRVLSMDSQRRPKPPLFFKLFGFFPCCAVFRRGFSASVSGPSMSTRRRLPAALILRRSQLRRCNSASVRARISTRLASASTSFSRRLPTVSRK